jgi:Transglutaminase-like superfamily
MGSSVWQEFERYRRLNPGARKLFQRAAVLLPQIALSLRLRGFKKTREALQKKLLLSRPKEPVENERVAEAVQLTCRMVSAGAHYGPLRPTCLVESLALWYLLQKQGIPANLRIGVRKASKKFEAHAWVEYAGTALNQTEEQHQHYAAFDSGFADLPGEQP